MSTTKSGTTLEQALTQLPGFGLGRAQLRLAMFGEEEARDYAVRLFDWRTLKDRAAGHWLNDTFCDGFIDGVLDSNDDIGMHWIDEANVPFAFATLEAELLDDELPSTFSALLCFDLAGGDGTTCPVTVVPIEGTAHPDGFVPLVKDVAALQLVLAQA